jgi:hypothetical protein
MIKNIKKNMNTNMNMNRDMNMNMDMDMDTDMDVLMPSLSHCNLTWKSASGASFNIAHQKTALRPQLNTVCVMYGAAFYYTTALH